MPSKKSYSSQIRETLQDAGLYDKRNEMIITRTANLLDLVDRMQKELRHGSLMLTQTGYMSQEKLNIHPYIAMIQKYEVVIGRNLIALGLGNVQSNKLEVDGIEELVNSLK